MKRIPFVWHVCMLIIGMLAAVPSALGWSILATASPFRLRVRHLLVVFLLVLLLTLVPALVARSGARRILVGLPLLFLPGMLLAVFRRANGMRFMDEPVMLAIMGGVLLLCVLAAGLAGRVGRGRAPRHGAHVAS